MISKHFAVVGDPIEHSLSPKIHQAAYDALGLDWDYSRFQVPAGELKSFLAEGGSSLTGVSVTMPLKKEAAALANKSDEIVKLTGVANTLVRTDNGLEAFNTDVYGISQSLAACFQLGVREVVILGAGATAISALVSTSASAPEASITVYARDVSRTQEIQHIAGILGLKIKVSTFNDITLRNDLLISTLPQGVLAEFAGSEASGWLLNTNYSSNEDSFAAAYNQDQVVGGRAMLLWQALAQIRIFLNGSADVALPNEALVFETMSNAL